MKFRKTNVTGLHEKVTTLYVTQKTRYALTASALQFNLLV